MVLFRSAAGPYKVTVFGEPVPIRAGAADISVMVQNSDSSTVLDAKVAIRLKIPSQEKIVELMAPATHDRATNKLLYAAHVTIPSRGLWDVAIDVTGANGATGSAAGQISVLPMQAPVSKNWPYFAVVPGLVLLFALNQWLRKRREIRRPLTRP